MSKILKVLKNAYAKVRQWLKSRTVNYGLLLSMFGVMQVYIEGLNQPFYTMLAGMLVVYLRFKTTVPVSAK